MCICDPWKIVVVVVSNIYIPFGELGRREITRHTSANHVFVFVFWYVVLEEVKGEPL
jgi:hypothetical protein